MEGLIHEARIVTQERGDRNEQGEATLGEPVAGPWIRARLMERGAVAPERRRQAGRSTDSKVPRGYELLLDSESIADEDHPVGPVVVTASSDFETNCDILGSPSLTADGEPEKLTDGENHIGWLIYCTKPKDRS